MTDQIINPRQFQPTSKSEQDQVRSGLSMLVQTAAALIFGAVILFGVGFAPLEAAHNAAHDVRHSLAFPCH